MATQNLENIKRRLSSVKSTLKITNAMKLVSSVKVKKIQNVHDYKKDLFLKYQSLLNDVIFTNSINPDCNYESIYLKENNQTSKKLYVVLSSNLGLCSNYNNNVINYLKNIYKNGDEILVIGQKGYIELNNMNVKLDTSFIDLTNNFDDTKLEKLINYLKDLYKDKKYNKIVVIYTQFINSIASKVNEFQLLPIKLEENLHRFYSPIYEPSKEEVIDFLIDKVLSTFSEYLIYDSMLSEENARRNAMDNATKNGNELIDKLNLEYNKARQAAITQEITEVVSGSHYND